MALLPAWHISLAHGATPAVCPDGWTRSGGHCYRYTVPSKPLGCVDLCGAGASLACIRSAEENAAVIRFVPGQGFNVVYGGNFRQVSNEHGVEAAWDMCASGESVNFTDWKNYDRFAHMDDKFAHMNCLVGGMEEWGWVPLQCLNFDYPCLCEYGADTSPKYVAFLKAQWHAIEVLTVWLWCVNAPALWLLPSLAYLAYRVCSRLVRRRLTTTTSVTVPLTHNASYAAGAALDAAEKVAKERRTRVVFTTMQLGWMLLVVGAAPSFLNFSDWELTPVMGSYIFYIAAIPWALALLALVLRPIDVAAIRAVGAFFFCFFIALASWYAYMCTNSVANRFRVKGYDPTRNMITKGGYAVISISALSSAALLWHHVYDFCACECCRRRAAPRMPPRRMLLRLWLVIRIGLFGHSVGGIVFVFSPLWTYYGTVEPQRVAPTWSGSDHQTAGLFVIANLQIAALILTPANRGRFTRWLAEITSVRSTREREAASVAALLSNRSAAATLAMGAELFRALPLASITREELDNSTPDPELYAKTAPATLGSVHGFASHSWTDPGDAKFDKLHEWANGEDKLVWLDKACLNQHNVQDSLACLPVSLAGCRQLLVLAGPTYASRLWCVMELFGT